MERMLIAITALALTGTPLSALPLSFAGPDDAQRMILERIQEQKQKLNAAKAAQGSERQKLMADHMKLMQETIGKMQTMKPRADMSPKEKDRWIVEHQKLMAQVIGQLMEQHYMLMHGMDK